MDPTLLERIAYAVARGVARAWLDVHAEYAKSQREVYPDPEAAARAVRGADAVRSLPSSDRHS